MQTRALVVGGTGGIGYAIARHLAANASSTVIISGRTRPQNIPHANIEFRQLDASSMKLIKQHTESYKSSHAPKIDLLVLTQGILTTAGRTETSEGIDRKMALHYYGRQLLIRELLPVLTDDAKVLIVLDGSRGDPAQLNMADLDLSANFSIANAAAHCISMTDGMIQAYAKQQSKENTKKRHFIHAYPGIVKTELFGSLPWYLRAPTRVFSQILGITSEECATNLLTGLVKVSTMNEKDGKFWGCIDSKGSLIENKPTWTADQIQQVEEHTWKIVDTAVTSSSSE
ncbi:putative oxidoreductase [Colletotrichum sp. SAR11_239]|nr:putative oxidoreductase [Colletotrichum sp. SAR11_239]